MASFMSLSLISSVIMNYFQNTFSDFGNFLHLFEEKKNLPLTQHMNTHEYTVFRLDKSYPFPIGDIFY